MSTNPPDLQRTFTGSIATYYDNCLGPAWFGKIAADLARRVAHDPGGDVLELACGTGLMTRPLRERLAPNRRLVATDLSKPMLDYARGKMADVGGIEWQEADAAKLPFADGAFAAVACSLGVMFVPDREKLFREVRRVLKSGGRFHFNVWDRIEANPCVLAYSQTIEALFPGDSELQFSLPYSMHSEELLRTLLDSAGFTHARIDPVRLAVEGVPALDIATGQVRGTPRGLLLAKRGVDFDVAIGKVAAALEKVGGEGQDFRSHCQVIAVEGVAP